METISGEPVAHTLPPLAPPLPRPNIRQWAGLRELVETLMLILAIYALVNLTTVRYIVDGPSMQPNFFTGQFIMVSRLNYLFGTPERGDIIVFHRPDMQQDDLIKRVIGLPGEHVEIRDGDVYVNGVMLDEPYINEQTFNCTTYCDIQLGPDQYFVMGDNRNRSTDSRAFGPVNRHFIVGEALLRYWPPQDWGIVSRLHFPNP
jgi:signal peptidase I